MMFKIRQLEKANFHQTFLGLIVYLSHEFERKIVLPAFQRQRKKSKKCSFASGIFSTVMFTFHGEISFRVKIQEILAVCWLAKKSSSYIFSIIILFCTAVATTEIAINLWFYFYQCDHILCFFMQIFSLKKKEKEFCRRIFQQPKNKKERRT